MLSNLAELLQGQINLKKGGLKSLKKQRFGATFLFPEGSEFFLIWYAFPRSLNTSILFFYHFIFQQHFISLFHQHWYRVFQPCAYWNDISERTQLSDKYCKIKHRLSYHARKLNVFVIQICWKEFSDIVDNSLCYEIDKHVSPKVRNRQNLCYMSCTNVSFANSYEHFCDEFSSSFWFDTLYHIPYMGILCFYHWNICGSKDSYRVHISCISF